MYVYLLLVPVDEASLQLILVIDVAYYCVIVLNQISEATIDTNATSDWGTLSTCKIGSIKWLVPIPVLIAAQRREKKPQ